MAPHSRWHTCNLPTGLESTIRAAAEDFKPKVGRRYGELYVTGRAIPVSTMRRRMEASIVLIKALDGGWNTTQLP
jgi:hypothetical protein